MRTRDTSERMPLLLADYGLGSFKGRPVVMVNNGITTYHLKQHGRFHGGVTFTEDFARNDCGARACRTCFPAAASSTNPSEGGNP